MVLSGLGSCPPVRNKHKEDEMAQAFSGHGYMHTHCDCWTGVQPHTASCMQTYLIVAMLASNNSQLCRIVGRHASRICFCVVQTLNNLFIIKCSSNQARTKACNW